MSTQIYTGTAQYNLIYVFAIHDDGHKDYLKIGETSFSSASSFKQLSPNCHELNLHAHARIQQYTKTALIQYELLHTELARIQVQLADGTIESTTFSDKDVHEVLDRSGFDRHNFYDTGKGSEWFKVSLPQAICAIRAVKEGRNTLTAAEISGAIVLTDTTNPVISSAAERPKPKIVLRDEQKACINKTRSVFAQGDRMLWDCKMRFGKTITAYSLVKEMGYQKVLVVTHRPAVVDGWRNDFSLIFEDDRVFVTKENITVGDRFTAEDAGIDAENDRHLRNLADSGRPFVYFASMQDLRGSALAGGKFDKNRGVFAMDWDIIIYDEAHEGTQTDLGLNVQKLLEEPKTGKAPKKVLQLSGTPYNLLNQYADDNVYSWDYVMEQQAKRDWDKTHPGDHNPYADLPEMRICTFDLRKKLANSYRYEDESVAFNFHEFFRTWTGDPDRDFRPLPAGVSAGDFVHESDVWQFLNLISTDSEDSNYPFATQEYRDMFKHTFWILPGVKEARAFSAMLKKHPVFEKYEIVNVAGEGDQEQPYDDALKAVREAIGKHSHTITLSCGKLTTGVTVKQWTGVMLLSGSASTGAAGYMQTIFRVQSAGSIDGKQKTVCYAFDFAPDRTLKVLSDVHSLKKSAVGTDDAGRVKLGEFLNFCPVLAEAETGMEFYDVPKMMRQLKRLTVDAAVKSGFDDDSIYKADAGIVMDKQKLQLMDVLKARLSPQKKGKQDPHVKVNDQGLTDEQYQKAQDAKRKPKRERTKEEQAALDKEKEMKKQQQNLFDLLRNVSIRLPLLIFGTAADFDESIRLAEFVDKVDAASWQEFMPKELDKELFLKLLVFYDEDVIEGAGMRIRRMAKAADELMPTRRVMKIAEIFTYFKNPAKETVLTPWRVVNMHMGNTIGGYNFCKEDYPMQDGLLEEPRLIEQGEVTSALFLNENVRILEMNSKSGLYPLYVAYTIYRMMLPKNEEQMTLEEAQSWWRRALRDHLFVLCQTTMAVAITKRTLAGYTGAEVNAIYLPKLLNRMEDKQRLARKLTSPATWKKEGERLKFDAVVGNPPYQLTGGSGGTNDSPIYQHFVQLAKKVDPTYLSFIMPSRWFTTGRENLIGGFRREMLTDRTISKMVVYTDSHDVFPSVEIKGGLCYFLMDSRYNGDCRYELIEGGARTVDMRNLGDFDILIRNAKLGEIVKKVMSGISSESETVASIVSSDTPFGIPTNPFGSAKLSIPVYRYISAEHNTRLYYLENMERSIAYVSKTSITKNSQDIDKYKVLIPEAGGSGNDPMVLGKPICAPENSICSQTFLYVPFESEVKALNFISYLQTKLFRILVSACKISQHAPSKTYRFVPMQDFSRPWTDADLYAKYGLTDEEISFIEATIKPMV